MNAKLLDLYSDYLISSFGKTTATGLSELLDGELSHDQITRWLRQKAGTSSDLWQMVKPHVRQIESTENHIGAIWYFIHHYNALLRA